jgi:5-formyltetrahydrofolate cyclo-ligase
MLTRRRAQPDKERLSDAVAEQLLSLAEYRNANVVMFYVDARSEVRTRAAIGRALAEGKIVAVPQCVGDELVPWRMTSLAELTAGAFGIDELREEFRRDDSRQVAVEQIDLVVVPGVAFDRRGHRLGSGRGFYDRFLERLRRDAVFVGLAFDGQLVEAIPTDDHDVPLHIVVTPSQVVRD